MNPHIPILYKRMLSFDFYWDKNIAGKTIKAKAYKINWIWEKKLTRGYLKAQL